MNRSLWLYSSSLFWGLALLALIQLARLWWYDPRRNTKSSVAKQLHFGVFVAAIGTRGVSYLFVARAVFFSWAHCFLIVSAVRATTTVLRNATAHSLSEARRKKRALQKRVRETVQIQDAADAAIQLLRQAKQSLQYQLRQAQDELKKLRPRT